MPAGTFLPPGLTTSDVKIASGGTDNYVMTAVDGETIQGESKLTFDGSDLTVATDVGIIFSDSGQKIESDGTDLTIASGAKLNLTPTSDVHIANGTGLVIGHTAQITTTDVREFQVLGTDSADSGAVFARFQAAGGGPVLQFLKSRDPAIADGTFAIVSDNDTIGSLDFHPDDGNDFATRAAQFIARVDDGSPEENFVGMEFVWKQMPGGDSINSGALIETMSIGANGMMTYGGGISRDTGIIFDNAGTDYHIGIDQTADALVIGEGTTLGAAGTEFIVITDANSAHSVYIKPTKTALVDTGANLAIGGSLTAAVDASISILRVGGTIIEAGSGTHPLLVGSNFVAPTITGAGAATTTGATVYISGAPATATNQYALFVDAGTSRFDGDLHFYGTVALASQNSMYFNIDADAGSTGEAFIWGENRAATSGGTKFMTLSVNGLALDNGNLFINDTANGNMTTGLTINQGAADNQILAFKSSDINTGLTTAPYPNVEVDDYAVFAKESDSLGGLAMTVLQASGNVVNLGIRAYGGTAQTTHTTAGRSLVEFAVYEHDDANALADITSQGNVFGIRAYVGGASATRFLVDEDGDLFAAQDGTTGVTVIDEYEDAHLVRAYDLSKRVKTGLVRSEWDKFIKYNEQDLIDVGVMGDTVENGGLLNVTGLQRLHNGAIWQGYVRQQEMQEKIDTLENRLLAIEGAK